MLLTKKLLGYLNRVFNRDPKPFLALRFNYRTPSTWSVSDGVLRTFVPEDSSANLTLDLKSFKLGQLADFISAQPGYSVSFLDNSRASLGACVLLDASNNTSNLNGDFLYGYTSVVWSYLESVAPELDRARVQIGEMVRQMSTRTAGDMWLDEIGGYYGIPRFSGEADKDYAPRIIVEVLRPRGNNIAIARAIKDFTGEDATVTDVVIYSGSSPAYNSLITHNSAYQHNATARPIYGLFDVEVGFDLLSGYSPNAFGERVERMVDLLRDAGTQMRSLALKASNIEDSFGGSEDDAAYLALAVAATLTDTLAPATDDYALAARTTLSDPFTKPTDPEAELTITSNLTYSGERSHGGQITYRAGAYSEALAS